jgi:hypothetical protein
MVVWEKSGDQDNARSTELTLTVRKLTASGTGKLDGKNYPITGDATADMRSFKLTSDKTIETISKKDGKTVGGGTIVVAADGKTRTVTSNITNAKGEKVTSTSVCDKPLDLGFNGQRPDVKTPGRFVATSHPRRTTL